MTLKATPTIVTPPMPLDAIYKTALRSVASLRASAP
jgi:hypothetical protein